MAECLTPLSLTLQVSDKSLQFCHALLIKIRHLLAQLVHSECHVCSILTEELPPCNLSLVLAVLRFGLMVLIHFLLHPMLLAFALNSYAVVQALSQVHQHVWDHVDTQFLVFPGQPSVQCIHAF